MHDYMHDSEQHDVHAHTGDNASAAVDADSRDALRSPPDNPTTPPLSYSYPHSSNVKVLQTIFSAKFNECVVIVPVEGWPVVRMHIRIVIVTQIDRIEWKIEPVIYCLTPYYYSEYR